MPLSQDDFFCGRRNLTAGIHSTAYKLLDRQGRIFISYYPSMWASLGFLTSVASYLYFFSCCNTSVMFSSYYPLMWISLLSRACLNRKP